MTGRTVSILLGASGALLVVSGGPVVRADGSACPDRDVLARNEYAVVFRVPEGTAGCLFDSGKTEVIGGVAIRGLTRLRGTVASFGEGLCDDDDCRRVSVLVYARDLRKPVGIDAQNSSDAGLETVEKVGSIRATRGLDLAWITCPSRYTRGWPDREPDCVRRGGRRKIVFKLPKGEVNPIRLDAGRGIDPRSLRLKGSTLTWIHSGHRRTATLR